MINHVLCELWLSHPVARTWLLDCTPRPSTLARTAQRVCRGSASTWGIAVRGGWSGYFPRKHVASLTSRFATPCGCASYETLVIYYQQKCHGSYFRFHCLSSWAVRSAWPPHGPIEGGVATSRSRLCNHRRLLSISIPLRQCFRTRNASVCFPLFFPLDGDYVPGFCMFYSVTPSPLSMETHTASRDVTAAGDRRTVRVHCRTRALCPGMTHRTGGIGDVSGGRRRL